MIYDYYKEVNKRSFKVKGALGIILILILAGLFAAVSIYTEVIQLNEIGTRLSSIYMTNLLYKIVFSAVSFIIIFAAISVTSYFARKNLKRYFEENSLPAVKLPNLFISFAAAVAGAFMSRNFFYQKALSFLNADQFGKTDPLFTKDIGYYVFERPFLMSLYQFASTLWVLVILYTAAYYFISLLLTFNNVTLHDLKVKSIIRHNLVNIAVFFIIKTFSYQFMKEGILFSSFWNVKGAGYIDVNVWMKYFTAAPYLLALIVLVSFIFIWRGKLRNAAYTIAIFPVAWILVTITASVIQSYVVKPNEVIYETPYLKYNMEKTREAYGLDKIRNFVFPSMQELTPEILNRNLETKNNIRVVDYKATLDSDTQLQANTNFYNFQDGDIINYTINGKEMPVFITAREIDTKKLPEKSYINTMFKYTHGYGVVINPINKLTPQGQVDFFLSGLRMQSVDPKLKITEPRIYYGEMTKEHVIVNGPDTDKLKEIDYDGNSNTSYIGNGGLKLNLLNKLLFAVKYADINILISGNVSSDSKLLLNRDVVYRAQKAIPFLDVDSDPYILLTSDGRLKWVLDAYTTTSYYPYSQDAAAYGNLNYIRNSVKIVVDAYDGDVKYYIIDNDDPIIKTYDRIYPGVFTSEPLPADIAAHTRYPELLFKIQTDMLKRYHLDPSDPQKVAMFYSQQDLWDIAKYPDYNAQPDNTVAGSEDSSSLRDIDPFYNMIKLPEGIGSKEELILMRPFTPSEKHNMVSWLAVRNSLVNYGEMILFSFPKDTNILGPNQVEVNINQIDEVSKDMTLWGQKGSRVFKGNLLVIPIESSVLYVEPIYIQSAGQSSIPQVRKVVVVYQKGDDFRHGVGSNLDEALNNLFKGIAPAPVEPDTTPTPAPGTDNADNDKVISDIKQKYEALKKQLDELGSLINELTK